MLRRAAPALLAVAADAGTALRPVLRAEQGPVQLVRLQGHPDRAFRRLLLRAGAGGRHGRRPDGGARLRPALQGAEPRVPRAEAHHPLRLALRFPADQRAGRRRPGRGHRRVSPISSGTGTCCPSPGRTPSSSTCCSTRWCTSSSTTPGPAAAPAAACPPSSPSTPRSGLPREWRSTCPSGRSIPRPPCGSGTPRWRATCPPSSR